MPVTRKDRNGADLSSTIGPVNTTAFLFGDASSRSNNNNNNNHSGNHSNRSSTVRGGFLQMNTNDDKFPVLIRRETDGKLQLPPASNALDLASPDLADPDKTASGWPSFNSRSQKSLSGIMSRNSIPLAGTSSPPHTSVQPASSGDVTPTKLNRHSMGPRIGQFPEAQRQNPPAPSKSSDTTPSGGPPKLQSSYSTNDIPTVKNSVNANPYGQPSSTAEERLHNHNASLGRIPRGAVGSNRTSRDFNKELSHSPEVRHEEPIPTMQTVLQGSASNFTSPVPAPASAVSSPPESMSAGPTSPASFASPLASLNNPNPNPNFYGGYGVQPNMNSAIATGMNGTNSMLGLNAMMGNMNMGLAGAAMPNQWNNHAGQFVGGAPGAFGPGFSPNPYQQYQAQNGQQGRFVDSQARVMQQRRSQGGDDNSRFANIALENLQGEIYGLCKDQHGCRYLQKKLEEGKPDQVRMIFDETKMYMIDLMTDPFGNYLCQKLLEQTTEEQRTVLINNAAPHMVRIALNQHGTRALQKMIEFVSTPAQVQTVIMALREQVVPMIQDLNGNHVIQKCLNRLSSEDAQFIFDAVASHCVVVGTHRHGCCVIQRCIDHASGNQKAQLVAAITASSYPLVQDPFGNYVLQYIFDQGEESFSQPLCRTFLGAIAMLSKQKFSSNVIEKCIRIADTDLKHDMIEEIINCPEFDRLADDAFANYVVQTAWDYANTEDEERLAERIRPVLPRMRHKPYGRRFQSRLAERDTRLGITAPPASSAEATPSFANAPMHRSQPSNDSSFYQSPPGSSHGVQINNGAAFNSSGYRSGNNGFVSQDRRISNPPYPGAGGFQGSVQQPYGQYRPAGQQGGNMNYF